MPSHYRLVVGVVYSPIGKRHRHFFPADKFTPGKTYMEIFWRREPPEKIGPEKNYIENFWGHCFFTVRQFSRENREFKNTDEKLRSRAGEPKSYGPQFIEKNEDFKNTVLPEKFMMKFCFEKNGAGKKVTAPELEKLRSPCFRPAKMAPQRCNRYQYYLYY